MIIILAIIPRVRQSNEAQIIKATDRHRFMESFHLLLASPCTTELLICVKDLIEVTNTYPRQ
jgi:hypothetical protein